MSYQHQHIVVLPIEPDICVEIKHQKSAENLWTKRVPFSKNLGFVEDLVGPPGTCYAPGSLARTEEGWFLLVLSSGLAANTVVALHRNGEEPQTWIAYPATWMSRMPEVSEENEIVLGVIPDATDSGTWVWIELGKALSMYQYTGENVINFVFRKEELSGAV